MPIRTIDLCAGIGGIRRGFELAGQCQNVLSAEIDEFACMTYEHLFGDDPRHDLTSDEFKELVKNTDYDVLLAGFPCQTFSNVGKKLGFRDQTKGTIFFHIAEIIQETRPKAVFLENVDHLTRHNGGKTFSTILNVLENDLDYQVIGVGRNLTGDLIYKPENFIRNSRNFGVPQNRPRTFIIAYDRKHYEHRLEIEAAALPLAGSKVLYEDLHSVLEMGAPARFYMSAGYLETLKKHRQRQKENGNNFGYRIVNLPEIEHPIANTLLATGGSGRERNLVIDPQEGIAGQLIGQKKTPINDECVRFMTPREWGKLQGFVGYAFMEDGIDRFSFPEEVSIVQQYKQFGNSVTIPVIEAMAELLLRYL